jgi:hypothetical protein
MNSFFTSSVIREDDDPDGSEEQEYRMPPWVAPPEGILGAVVAVNRVLSQGPHVVIAMPHATAYPDGLLLHLTIAARRGDLPDETWWDLEGAVFGHPPYRRRGRGASGLPDSVCRYGVQLPDGAKAATLAEDHFVSDEEPSGPVLTSAGGGGGSGSDDTLESTADLWLWPLPPPEPFDFVVEWPAAGVAETRMRLDGARLVAAASEARPLWPEVRPGSA